MSQICVFLLPKRQYKGQEVYHSRSAFFIHQLYSIVGIITPYQIKKSPAWYQRVKIWVPLRYLRIFSQQLDRTFWRRLKSSTQLHTINNISLIYSEIPISKYPSLNTHLVLKMLMSVGLRNRCHALIISNWISSSCISII